MITAIVQARMGSKRLPGKVMEDIKGHSLLWHVLTRVKYSKLIDKIILATSKNKQDEVLVNLAENMGIATFAGSETDVLDRFYKISIKYKPKLVVRLTADCPLIDPTMIDNIIKFYVEREGRFDYVHRGENYPEGVAEVEVFSHRTLKKVWSEARKKSEKEHVTSYIWNNPDKFKIGEIDFNSDFGNIRLEVDEANDLKVVRQIYNELYKEGEIFYWRDIWQYLKRHPEIIEINKDIERNEGYKRSLRND